MSEPSANDLPDEAAAAAVRAEPTVSGEAMGSAETTGSAEHAASEAPAAAASADSTAPTGSAATAGASAAAGAAAPGVASATAARSASWWGWLGPYRTLAIVALVAVVAIVLWSQQRGPLRELASRASGLTAELEIARAELARVEDEIGRLDAALATERELRAAELARLREQSDALPVELRALERQIEAMQGGRVDARETWLKEQAEYYLVLANTELVLGGRIGSAIEALELADSVLRTLGDPGLARVRAAIGDELQALRSVRQVDLEGLVLALGSLSDEAAELPMRDQAPGDLAAADETDEDAAGLSRLLAQTRGAVTSIVRVERQDGPVAQLLTEAERRVVRRQLALEFQLARVAAFEGRAEEFRASLARADAVLEQDFNLEAQSVLAARASVATMMQAPLDPALPDISDSLRLLRSATGA
jgi:uroporphyrin-3 C-methyltransferase